MKKVCLHCSLNLLNKIPDLIPGTKCVDMTENDMLTDVGSYGQYVCHVLLAYIISERIIRHKLLKSNKDGGILIL